MAQRRYGKSAVVQRVLKTYQKKQRHYPIARSIFRHGPGDEQTTLTTLEESKKRKPETRSKTKKTVNQRFGTNWYKRYKAYTTQ